MLAPAQAPAATLGDAKEKFKVQHCAVGADVREVSTDLFKVSSGRDVKETKLRVVLVRCLAAAAALPRLL